MAIGAIYSPKVTESSVTRKFVSQGTSSYAALMIFDGQVPVDPPLDTVKVKVYFNDTTQAPPGEMVASAEVPVILRDDIGKFRYEIGPELTQQRGLLTVVWNYEVNDKDFTFTENLQIQEAMPLYDRLSPEERSVVEAVSWMFADGFDSMEGGPYLFETYQSHYNYERIAQLMRVALFRINTTGNPPTEFEVGGVPGQYSPHPAFLRGTLVIGTYIEVLKHLIRSYAEIPVFAQANVSHADRTGYMQRWQQILATEERGYKSMVIQAKRKLLGLGSTAMIVGGGPWFGGSNAFVPGMYSASVRGARFYPAAPALYGQLARTR